MRQTIVKNSHLQFTELDIPRDNTNVLIGAEYFEQLKVSSLMRHSYVIRNLDG